MAISRGLSSFSRLQGDSHKITHFAKTKPTNVTQILNNNARKWRISQHNRPLVLSPSSSFTKDEFSIGKPKKMEDVRQLLCNEDPLERLVMIDAIQRLGIEHRFQHEIEAFLRKEYMQLETSAKDFGSSLFEVALRFRLLRQEGYYVRADVFNKFKDMDGAFKQKLSNDARGLMELYEASQLSLEGEDILDEAKDFCSQKLMAQIARLDHLQARVVGHTLAHPHRKSWPGFAAKNTPIYNLEETSRCGWMNMLRELARKDLSWMQSIHQMETHQVSKWWEEQGVAKDLKFVRDQPVKWYMWSMASLPHPSLSEERVDLTKPISLIYVIDDIFDVVGTLDELNLFTQAVNRWKFDERLPDYMKTCFKTLDEITNEIGSKIYIKYGWNPIHSLRKAWASLCSAFLVEAEWFASGCLPKEEEYLRNGVVSSGVHIVLVHIFFLLGEGITKETVDYLDETPPIISSTATILRLWDDLGTAKDENQEGNDGSYIECYMREHPESTVEIARARIAEMISDAQKQLNRECLSPSPFSASFRRASLNIATMVPLMYAYDDNQRLPLLEQHMEPLLHGTLHP